MRIPLLLVSLSAGRALAQQAAETAPSLLGPCEALMPAVGSLTAQGRVSFLVDSAGHADTSTVAVLAAAGTSEEAYLSATRRHLATCRFRPGRRGDESVDARVTMGIGFKNRSRLLSVSIPTALRASNAGVQVPDQVHTLNQVEEGPVEIWCGPFDQGDTAKPVIRTLTLRGGTNFVIAPTGSVEQAFVSTRLRAKPDVEADARTFIQQCVFLPGRLRGLPVRTYVGREVGFEVRLHE